MPESLRGSPLSKRETLASRSERVIGKPLDSERDLSSSQPRQKKSPTRRREQISKAQRTHRQRTQHYIRELEKEVIRLREEDQTLRSANRDLETQLRDLHQSIAANGLSVPPRPEVKPRMPSSSANYHERMMDSSSRSPESISVNLNGLDSVLPERANSIRIAEAPDELYNPGLTSSGQTPDSNWSSKTPSSISVNFNDIVSTLPHRTCSIQAGMAPEQFYEQSTLETILSPIDRSRRLRSDEGYEGMSGASLDTKAALDFVLTLEKPCLAHVKFAYMTDNVLDPQMEVLYNSGPAHVLTTSASLLHSHHMKDASSGSFEMPKDDLDRLLQTSRNLNLGREVTPIQIWSSICDLSTQHAISTQMMRSLIAELGIYMRCNGFGSVVDKTVANAILASYFTSFRPYVLSELTPSTEWKPLEPYP